jgi:5-(carboxyamino)imidazole ribonucleotide mutase
MAKSPANRAVRSPKPPVVGIIMGSKSDWEAMSEAVKALDALGIPNEARVISAHRTPDRHHAYVTGAKARGLKAIIAGAGAAAHLAGVTAALTDLPVLGVPLDGTSLRGLDSLLSTVQMPGGIPVATFAVGKAGAKNAALFAGAMLALSDKKVAKAVADYRKKQTDNVPEFPNRD